MALRLFDSATRQKRKFEPQDPGRVTLYVCGPTVYNYAHIGNMRPVVVFDVLFRVLQMEYGPDAVIYARNFTDIDDKIIEKMAETNQSLKEITETFRDIYIEDTTALGALRPTIEPLATQHVGEMIEMISLLERKGYAYSTASGVFFNVPQMEEYGRLSGRKLEDNQAGARVAVDGDKRNPADFALWKAKKPEDPEEATWDSPWGKGRPGWHIECSAMAAKHLGKTIDIHAGGIDLQFPHHENEIAQSECSHGEEMARYWMHNGFLDMDGEKMSKSLGNVRLVHDLLKTVPGEVLRFALLSGHYRAPLDWTEDLIQQSKATLNRFYGALRRVWDSEDVRPTDSGVWKALNDDLNTPIAIAELSRLAGEANNATDRKDEAAMAEAKANMLAAGELLGLLSQEPSAWEQGGDVDGNAEIDALVQQRIDARAAKDWAEADRLRDVLTGMGIEIMDSGNGATWRRA